MATPTGMHSQTLSGFRTELRPAARTCMLVVGEGAVTTHELPVRGALELEGARVVVDDAGVWLETFGGRTALVAGEAIELGTRLALLATFTPPAVAWLEAQRWPHGTSGDDPIRSQTLAALASCNGNQTRAARMLGIARSTLVKRLDAYGTPRPQKGLCYNHDHAVRSRAGDRLDSGTPDGLA
jgi:transcriptional regulator of acetoin/glycerol metabolism